MPFHTKTDRLHAAAPVLLAKCKKVVAWLNKLAEASDKSAAANSRFESLKEACIADAKYYRATAADIQKAIDLAGRESK